MTDRRSAPLLLGAFGTQGALVVTGVVAARLLGVEGRGLFSSATLIPSIATFLAGLSTPQLATLLVANGSSARATFRRVLRSTTPLLAVSTVLVAIATFIALRYVDLSILAALSVWPLALNALCIGVLRGEQRWWPAAILQLASPTFFAVALVVSVVIESATAAVAMSAWVIGGTVNAVLALALLRARGQRHEGAEIPLPSSRKIRQRGAAALLATYSPLESLRLDQVLVIALYGVTSLGVYVTALSFSNLSRLVGQAFSASVAHVARTSRTPIWSLRKYLVLSLAAGVALAAVAPWLVVPVFGSDFADARVIAVPLCLAGGFMSARTILVELLRAQSRERIATGVEVSVAVGYALSLSVCVILAPGELISPAIALAVWAAVGASAMGVLGARPPLARERA